MNAEPTAPFWMIYGIGNGRPTAMHPTREAAEHEAKRLARANPGTFFVVLESVAAVVKRDVDVIAIRRRDCDGIPF